MSSGITEHLINYIKSGKLAQWLKPINFLNTVLVNTWRFFTKAIGQYYPVLILAGIIFLLYGLSTIDNWDKVWGHDPENNVNSFWDAHERIRNLGLVLLAMIGLPLAVWRSIVAQNDLNHKLRSELNERFQNVSNMLSSDRLSVRQAGIYALRDLALEKPETYYITVQTLLCSFILDRSDEFRENRTGERGKTFELIPKITQADYQEQLDEHFSGGATLPKPPADIITALQEFSRIRKECDEAAQLETDQRVKFSLVEAYLRGTDLRGADLRGANLRWADLRGANLRWANLRGANLRWADLRGADLRGADLQGADLREANLRGTDLRGADLRGANLRWANLRGADLQGADLRGADLRGADLQGADLREANLRALQAAYMTNNAGIRSLQDWIIERLETSRNLEYARLDDGWRVGGKNLELDLDGNLSGGWTITYEDPMAPKGYYIAGQYGVVKNP